MGDRDVLYACLLGGLWATGLRLYWKLRANIDTCLFPSLSHILPPSYPFYRSMPTRPSTGCRPFHPARRRPITEPLPGLGDSHRAVSRPRGHCVSASRPHPPSPAPSGHDSGCWPILGRGGTPRSPLPHLTSRVWRALACIGQGGRDFLSGIRGSSVAGILASDVLRFSLTSLWGLCTGPSSPFPRPPSHVRSFPYGIWPLAPLTAFSISLFSPPPRMSIWSRLHFLLETHLLRHSW
jgi:hypothetical protein